MDNQDYDFRVSELPFNKLTPAEAERLAFLAEECGEVIQIVGKVLRHGYGSVDPTQLSAPDNRFMLERELGDLHAVVQLMMLRKDIDPHAIAVAATSKTNRLRRYSHHQEWK